MNFFVLAKGDGTAGEVAIFVTAQVSYATAGSYCSLAKLVTDVL